MAAATQQQQETKIKLRVESAAWAIARLAAAGFVESAPRVRENNLLLDSAGAAVRTAGCVLRTRTAGERAMLMYKGPSAITGGHKTREEIETGAHDAAALFAIFARLGYTTTSRYEKYRTEFIRLCHTGGTAMLDETPIGVFLELEGEPAWIDAAAQATGFSTADYIFDSYSSLFRTYCENNRLEIGEGMIFSQTP